MLGTWVARPSGPRRADNVGMLGTGVAWPSAPERALARRLDQAIAAHCDQQHGGQPLGLAADFGSKSAPDEQSHDRHARLKQPEDERDPEPGAAVDPARAYADRGCQVRGPDGDSDKDQGEHE